MSNKTKAVKTKQPATQKATPVAATPAPAQAVPMITEVPHKLVNRFSVKRGDVVDDSKGNFVKFSDFKAVSEQHLKLTKSSNKFADSCERVVKEEIASVFNDAIKVITIAVEAVNAIDDKNPKKEKIGGRLVKACAKMGINLQEAKS